MIEKVTAFITNKDATHLVLFKHPTGGIQIPAGTMEEGEAVEDAVLREAKEETRLFQLAIRSFLGSKLDPLPENRQIITHPTKVYAQPNPISFDWGSFPRAAVVTLLGRQKNGYVHVTYEEPNKLPNPDYISFQITGWVPENLLQERQTRHYYYLVCEEETPDQWEVFTDNHTFTLFWAPLDDLPEIIYPQNEWVEMFMKSSQ